jgi:formate hydrogenlyase subunit 6/NADH:ubiquinone oxidoreductase subunit I
VLCFALVSLLFLDFTGTLHAWFGWLAKVQLLPAVLAVNVGIVLFLVVLTLLLGRVYCSVICPLGVFQDIVAWLRRKLGKRKRNPYRYSPAKNWLRYGVLALFVVLMVAGASSIALLVAPYSAYGRIASSLFAPLWGWGNNVLAYFAERADSYTFYQVDVWLKSLSTLVIAVLTLGVVGVLAWRGGRTYCNTICPVGTVLGFISRFSLFRPTIEASLCNGCGVCARNCKAACINAKEHSIDYSRCVACMNCMEKCTQGALRYVPIGIGKKETTNDTTSQLSAVERPEPDLARRGFLTATLTVAAVATLKAQEKKVDGGLATIVDKKIPKRELPIYPPGALSANNFTTRCTACQLCVSVCPNEVLRPSAGLLTLMKPEMSYERGYCRPECVKCSEVCPTGAIKPISTADKSATQIGHAVWIRENCLPATKDVHCNNCARHCPTEAIQMVRANPDDEKSQRIPAINVEKCIGCGACENLCPARPFSAIFVNGIKMHHEI